jgi:RHS repeat-associated protein
MLSDGRWNYTWDAENRLVKVESRSDTPQASWRRVEWTFDPLGRRIRQTTSVWTNNTWAVVEDLKFISDPLLFGRHIAELNASDSALVRTYVWGLDLSGTEQGAGGVGGLLMFTHHGSPVATHFSAYDGNGNVVVLVSASDGSATAHYEYGPFGEPIRVSGPAAGLNPFRFSTKRTDPTTELVLYEYRVYQPRTGRWLNRDALGEFGGMNLYGMAGNDPVNWFDVLGLCKKGDCQVKYFGSKNRRLAYFSIQNFADQDLGTPPQEIVDLILATTLEEVLERLSPVFYAIASRITLILTTDKNALLHWELRYKAKAYYEIRKCECKKRNPWTLWICCSEWGWSKPSTGTIGLKASFSGEDFTPDVNDQSALLKSLMSSFIESFRDGQSQYVTVDGWVGVFQEEIEKRKDDLGCKNIEFVTDFK